MITAAQIRAGRALLRWSARELAAQAGVSLLTIQRMEQSEGVPASLARNLDAVQRALEHAGVVFIPENGGGPGVRLAQPITPKSRKSVHGTGRLHRGGPRARGP